MAPTMPRPIRVPDPEWQAALAAARANGETLTDVVRRALRAYAAGDEATVRLAERQGQVVADVITAILDDLDLSSDQRLLAAAAIPRRLRAVAETHTTAT